MHTMTRLAAVLLTVLLIGAQAAPPQQPRLESVPRAGQTAASPSGVAGSTGLTGSAGVSGAKPAADQDQEQPFKITIGVKEVSLPVTFIDNRGEFVTDVERPEVTIYDNKVAQKIETFEISYRPISLVILINTSARMEGVLPDLRTSGILFTQLVVGETGEAAVLTYAKEVTVRQPFTTNGDLVEKAFKDARTEEDASHVTDGMFRAIGILQSRPSDRRRVVVVIGEGRDMGSELKKNQALREAQLSNISIYSVETSSFKAIAKKPLPQGPTMDPFPPGSRPGPSGTIPIPMGEQTMDIGTPVKETLRYGMSLIWNHPLRTYAGGTGSNHIDAYTLKGVEEAVQLIGRELHSQYWLTYRPTNLTNVEEYHTIDVRVNRPGLKVRARPGYFYVPSGDENVVEPDKKPK
jgi:VWFA-related protein